MIVMGSFAMVAKFLSATKMGRSVPCMHGLSNLEGDCNKKKETEVDKQGAK